VQGYARGRFTTGPLSHRIAAFTTYGEGGFDLVSPVVSFNVASNLYNPVRVPDPGTRPGTAVRRNFIDRQRAGYALADEIGILDDRVVATLGVRHTRLWNLSNNTITGVRSRFEGSETTPILGLLFRPLPWLSVFGNYVETLEFGQVAPSSAANRDTPTEPFKSRQYEAGIKVERGTLGATLAVFDIARQSAFTDPATNIFAANGQQVHQGVELLGYGELRPGIRLLGGVTYIDPVLTRTAGGTFDGNQAPDVPNWRAVASADVEFGETFGILPGVSAYASLAHSGPFYLDAANRQKVDGYTLLDLGAAYRTMIGQQAVTARLSVENVTDEQYWIGARNGSLGLGTPRTFLLSTSLRL
jgi:iron complex outermembrane receptor protein